jgi:glutamate-ammonia-ligase adenylyltransferase
MTGNQAVTAAQRLALVEAIDRGPSAADSPEVASALRQLGLRDLRRGLMNLGALREASGREGFDALLPGLADALAASADADMALNSLDRIVSACADRDALVGLWSREPRCVDAVAQLCGTSQLLADILREEALGFCRQLGDGPGPPSRQADEMHALAAEVVAVPGGHAARLDALRRFKRRELLRIASRDVLRIASFGELVEEISDLAAACLQVALGLAWDETPVPRLPGRLAAPEDWWREFAVIAMGKLGARELNYSSDVDLLFVYDAPWAPEGEVPDAARRYFTRLAQALVEAVGALTGDGGLFRVDMRLRPEGGAGALTRTVAAYATYWEAWAAPWERQALIKASWVAGSRPLAERFLRLARDFVYGKRMDTSGLADIKAVKSRVEASARRSGWDRNVKLGPGGIRDIEFTVQLLQLVFGADDERVRKRSTLGALRALGAAGYLSKTEHQTLASGYVFLRTLEHQLQLMHGLGVRELPADEQALDRLARRLEFPESAGAAPGEFLMGEYRRHTANARELFGKLFAEMFEERDESDIRARSLVLLAEEDADAAALGEFGLQDAARGLEVLRRLAHGTVAAPLPATVAEQFADLAPRILRAAARTPDPDASLLNFERFCALIGSRGALYSILSEEPKVIDMLVRVAGCSASLSGILAAHPEYFDMLMDPGTMTAARSAEKLAGELAVRLEDVADPEARLQTVSRFRRRELLRIGVRDLMGDAEVETTIRELTSLAEACLRAILDIVAPEVTGRSARDLPFAVIGVGKLAGEELHYNSDLDVMFVWGDPTTPHVGAPFMAPQTTYMRLASEIMSRAAAQTGGEGPRLKIDARLRPEGQSGPLARSVASCREYYASRAETWERLALIRSRLVAGEGAVWAAFREATEGFLWGSGLSADELQAIVHIKGRIERERARVEGGRVDVKLGPGGINDIEFCVQMLQLAHGHEDPTVRVPGTLGGLRALAKAGCFASPQDAADLEAAYLFLRRIECRLQIVHSWEESTVEPGPNGIGRLARLLEYRERDGRSADECLAADLERHRARVRGLYEGTVERLGRQTDGGR